MGLFMKRAGSTLLLLCLLCVPILAQTDQKIANISKKVVGKWVSADRKSYIEFSADGSFSTGKIGDDGVWHVDHNVLDAPWSQSDDFTCGSGALELIGSNTLTRDYGMGGEPDKFYRGAANMPKPVGPLTLAIAQITLNEQINQTTVHNSLLTCVACYDADDKADNDNAVLVSTYSPSMSQFLKKRGYIRAASNRHGYTEVFTAKAKRSKYYNDRGPGLRLADFRNPRILTSRITDPKHVPIG
jgi:hypothetical protein